jgi:hypothetical protein
MRSEEFDAVAARAAAGDAAAFSELTLLLQKDLLVVIATYACDRDMLVAVYGETWSAGRAWLAEVRQPRPPASGGLWMGRPESAQGWSLALRLREQALVLLRERLGEADQQAIANQDALRHLIAQAGCEALPATAAQIPEVLATLRDKIRLIPPAANGLLAKRYAEDLPLAEIASAQGRSPAEVAAALSLARGAVDWNPGGMMLVDPGDNDFPLAIEDYIAGTIAYDARLALAESLLADISRTAGFVRQNRLDLVLAAYSQPPPADVPQPAGSPPGPARPSNRLAVAGGAGGAGSAISSGLHPVREGLRQGGSAAGRPLSAAGRPLKGGAAPAPKDGARLWFMISGALVVLAVGAGVIGLSHAGPASAARPAPVTVASEPTAAPAHPEGHAEPPPASGFDSARVEAGLAIVRRSGVRFRLQPPALIHAGEGIETEADKGPLALSLRGGRTLTIGVNAQVGALTIGSGERDGIQLDRGQARVEVPAGGRAIQVRVGKAGATGDGAAAPDGAAFTVTTSDGGMRLEVGRGLAALETGDARSGGWVFPGQLALVGASGEVAVESAGTFVAGIKLAGAGLEVEGHRWKSQRQAQADGLSVRSGVAVVGQGTADPALKPLLDQALGGEIQLSQTLPNGTYDVVAWLSGTPGGDAGLLTVSGDALKKHEREVLGPDGWRRSWPRRCTVAHGSLEIELHGGQLAGLAFFACGGPDALPALPPSAFLDQPADDLSVTAPGSLTLSASAYAPGGSIRAVQFLVDAQKIGESSAPPYTCAWPYAEAGKHRIAVQAVHSNGLTAPSLTVTVTVLPAGKPKPLLLLALADPKAPVTSAAPITLAVTGEHLESAIAKVEFRSDGLRLGEAGEAPWHFAWSRAPAGEHALTAIATLAGGGTLAAEPVGIVVTAPAHVPPQIAIESPEDGTEVADGGRLVIRAKASASEGRVAKVEFLADGQKIGDSAVAPFSCAWAKAAPGAHQITATATDSSGAKATSDPVLVLVGRSSGFLLVRGICLGGEPIDLDGGRWLAQEQALAGGLALSPGKTVSEAFQPLPAVDPAVAQMLTTGYEAAGNELRVTQEAPDGFYQVALWLGEGKAANAHLCELEVQGVKQAQPIGRLAKGGWAKYGPFLVKVKDQRLALVLRAKGAGAPRLMGLAIYASPFTVAAPVVERFPRPQVELLFDPVTGNTTPNSGLCADLAPTATLTSPWPQRRTNVPPGHGSACMDFGHDLGSFGVGVAGGGRALRGLKSFTISAWINPHDLQEGSGGSRLAAWTTGAEGVDFAVHADGSLQLGVNAWNDQGGLPRSSPGKLVANEQVPLENWRFVAASYDSTVEHQQVRYYFGSAADKVALDRAEDGMRGAVGMNPPPDIGIGNQVPSLLPVGRDDRMFRGLIGQLRIWGSAVDGSGALSAEQLAAVQAAATAGIRLPTFARPPAAAPGAPAAPPGTVQVLVDDFERDPVGWAWVGGWEFPGAKGAANREAAGVAHSGTHSYRLDYDFTGGGAYVGVWKTLEALKVPDVKEFHIWVKTDSVTSLGVRLGDGSDQTHQSSVRLLKTPEWQEVVIKVAEASVGEHWGGANDGQWHAPAKGFGLNIGKNPGVPADQQKGSIWFDDFSAVVVPPGKP